MLRFDRSRSKRLGEADGDALGMTEQGPDKTYFITCIASYIFGLTVTIGNEALHYEGEDFVVNETHHIIFYLHYIWSTPPHLFNMPPWMAEFCRTLEEGLHQHPFTLLKFHIIFWKIFFWPAKEENPQWRPSRLLKFLVANFSLSLRCCSGEHSVWCCTAGFALSCPFSSLRCVHCSCLKVGSIPSARLQGGADTSCCQKWW